MSDPNTNSNPELDPKLDAEAAGQEETHEGAPLAEGAEKVLEEWKNKVVYLAAEMENMKKRFVREKADVIKMANEELIKAMIPVFDNLDLGLKSIKNMESKIEGEANAKIFANLMKGVEMTLSHFQQTLERVGVQAVPSVGKPFDPSLHEAMGQTSAPEFEDNHVSSEFQKGFSLNGRVIRTAKVMVNKKVSAN